MNSIEVFFYETTAAGDLRPIEWFSNGLNIPRRNDRGLPHRQRTALLLDFTEIMHKGRGCYSKSFVSSFNMSWF